MGVVRSSARIPRLPAALGGSPTYYNALIPPGLSLLLLALLPTDGRLIRWVTLLIALGCAAIGVVCVVSFALFAGLDAAAYTWLLVLLAAYAAIFLTATVALVAPLTLCHRRLVPAWVLRSFGCLLPSLPGGREMLFAPPPGHARSGTRGRTTSQRLGAALTQAIESDTSTASGSGSSASPPPPTKAEPSPRSGHFSGLRWLYVGPEPPDHAKPAGRELVNAALADALQDAAAATSKAAPSAMSDAPAAARLVVLTPDVWRVFEMDAGELRAGDRIRAANGYYQPAPEPADAELAGTEGLKVDAAAAEYEADPMLDLREFLASAVPPRTALIRLWVVVRALLLAFGMVFALVYVYVRRLLDHTTPKHVDDLDLPAEITVAASFVLCAALLNASVRARAHQWLGSIGYGRRGAGARAAASVAAMVGETLGSMTKVDAKVSHILKSSEKSFRALPLSALQPEDIGGSTADLADTRDEAKKRLRARTSQAKLGYIDAFLSHSWRDGETDAGRDAKWLALQEWKAEFRNRMGREPTIWLDMACLCQQNIDQSLACLPVYLGGCRNLLILAGQTYTRRLWCVIELYVYLQVGGKPEAVHIVPLLAGGDTDAKMTALQQVTHQFRDFDAARAECFKPEERQKLLGVIERGFGSLGSFNHQVSALAKGKIHRSATLRKLEVSGRIVLDNEVSQFLSRPTGQLANSGSNRALCGASGPSGGARPGLGSGRLPSFKTSFKKANSGGVRIVPYHPMAPAAAQAEAEMQVGPGTEVESQADEAKTVTHTPIAPY